MSKIQELLDRKLVNAVIGLPTSASAVEAASVLANNRIGILVCRDDAGGMAGVLSERDVVRAISERDGSVAGLTVGDLITRDVETCTPRDEVKAVVRRMGAGGFRHMPVVDGDRTVGLISVTDIFRFYLDNKPDDRVEILRAYYTMSIP